MTEEKIKYCIKTTSVPKSVHKALDMEFFVVPDPDPFIFIQ
jgi:hypothetical protein